MIVVVLLVFGMLQLTPGDPVQAMVGQYPVPPEFRAAIEHVIGLAATHTPSAAAKARAPAPV